MAAKSLPITLIIPNLPQPSISFAPTGRHSTVQGNAGSRREKEIQALKGRPQFTGMTTLLTQQLDHELDTWLSALEETQDPR
jgi:hypothetical protein